jgi:hypothetical protein
MKIKESKEYFKFLIPKFTGIFEWCDGSYDALNVGYVIHLKNGKYHREDGPAIEYGDGKKEWWINGKNFLQEENWKLKIEKFRKNGLASK